MNDFNKQIIDEFRTNAGKVAMFGDAPVVILRTIGARSGATREIPLVALVEDEGMYVFASAAGAPKNPDWYHNLKANPEIDVEYGTEVFRARLAELDDSERSTRLDHQAALIPQFGEYIPLAEPRLIPAFSVTRV